MHFWGVSAFPNVFWEDAAHACLPAGAGPMVLSILTAFVGVRCSVPSPHPAARKPTCSCLPATDHFPAEIVVFSWALTPRSPAAGCVAQALLCLTCSLCSLTLRLLIFFSAKLCYFLPCLCFSPSPLSLLSSSVCISFSFLLLLNPPSIWVRMPTTLWWEVAVVLNLP